MFEYVKEEPDKSVTYVDENQHYDYFLSLCSDYYDDYMSEEHKCRELISKSSFFHNHGS